MILCYIMDRTDTDTTESYILTVYACAPYGQANLLYSGISLTDCECDVSLEKH